MVISLKSAANLQQLFVTLLIEIDISIIIAHSTQSIKKLTLSVFYFENETALRMKFQPPHSGRYHPILSTLAPKENPTEYEKWQSDGFGTKIFRHYAPKNVARENFRFGAGSKKFPNQNEKIPVPLFQETRVRIAAIAVRKP